MTKRLSDEEFFCRVCLSNNIEQFKLVTMVFQQKKKIGKAFFVLNVAQYQNLILLKKLTTRWFIQR